MIKQFEVGKSYYRELPSNPSFAVVEECKKGIWYIKPWMEEKLKYIIDNKLDIYT